MTAIVWSGGPKVPTHSLQPSQATLAQLTPVPARLTVWNQAETIAALISTKGLHLVSATEVEGKLSRTLATLATVPRHENTSNKRASEAYAAKPSQPQTLLLSNSKVNLHSELGLSALELERVALWLETMDAQRSQIRARTSTVWQQWRANLGQKRKGKGAKNL